MTRYFPELLPGIRALSAARVVLDGEIIIVGEDGLDFDSLQLRLHPAESRVRMLAEKIPSQLVAFDLIAIGDEERYCGKPIQNLRPSFRTRKALKDILEHEARCNNRLAHFNRSDQRLHFCHRRRRIATQHLC